MFFGKFGVLCFLETPVLRFALLPCYRYVIDSDYSRGKKQIQQRKTYCWVHSKFLLCFQVKNFEFSYVLIIQYNPGKSDTV